MSGQIVVEVFWLMLAVYIAAVLWRVTAQLFRKRAPTVTRAIEFAFGTGGAGGGSSA